jgi:hypothetical protein
MEGPLFLGTSLLSHLIATLELEKDHCMIDELIHLNVNYAVPLEQNF